MPNRGTTRVPVGSPRRRPAGSLAGCLLLMLAATACGGSGGSGTDTGSPVVVTITEQGGSISADSDLVHAALNQKIVLKVTTDAADEIHVHSVPEHEFEIKPGPEETFSFRVGTPGTVEVESHELDQTILKLEVQ